MVTSSDAPHVDARDPADAPRSTPTSPFELRAGPYAPFALTVLSLRGREAVSRQFSFEIVVAASPEVDDSAIETDLLGRPACLVMQAGASVPRFVRGIIVSVAAQSAVHGRRAIYRLRLVPALWLLKKHTTSRIFQDKTVPEIVAAVLDEAGVKYGLRLVGSYRPRTYCVQHRETDFAFVERLLAEDGIFYTFDHGGPDADAEIVILTDSARNYPLIDGDPELVYRPHKGVAGMALSEDHLQSFDLRRSLRPTSVLRWSYDFRRPANKLAAEAMVEDIGGGAPERRQVYGHHEEDEEPNLRSETATAELEQHRARVEVGHGESGCRRLTPGARFTLCDHDLTRLDREYVVTEVKHKGQSPETATSGEAVYANTFECVPATIVIRPRRAARSIQQVTETALVVGPNGQEIYTDEYGRVKVQFHWDREGRRDEHSSCWIRVAQAWAGSGWGFQFIPRVGMEVVVTFLGGDVDRPLVTGCLYNAMNPPSQLLPAKMTRSGIRTHTTPGGGGFNELTFDDQAGAEQVFLRAQRRLDEVIVGDHSISIGGGESSLLAGNRMEGVGGNLDLKIAGKRVEDVRGNHCEKIGGNFDRTVDGEQRTVVQGDGSAEVGGNQTHVVRGNHHVLVGHGKADGSHALFYVNGDYTVGVSEELKLSAKKAIKLSVGDSSIEITSEGIKLTGKSVVIEGTDGAIMKVKDHVLTMNDKLVLESDTINLFSSKGSILMDDDVHLDGKIVYLNCKPKAPDPAKATAALPEEGIVTFRVKARTNGEPKVGVTMLIATPSGEVIEREADAEGKVEIKGKKGENFVLVAVRYGDHVFGHQGS